MGQIGLHNPVAKCLLQLSGNTSDFSALNHQVEMAEYSEVPYSRPVFFPSMNIRRKKNDVVSPISIIQRKEYIRSILEPGRAFDIFQC